MLMLAGWQVEKWQIIYKPRYWRNAKSVIMQLS